MQFIPTYFLNKKKWIINLCKKSVQFRSNKHKLVFKKEFENFFLVFIFANLSGAKRELGCKLNLTFDNSNWSQFDGFLADASRMARIDDIGYIFIWFGRLFHYQFRRCHTDRNAHISHIVQHICVFQFTPWFCSWQCSALWKQNNSDKRQKVIRFERNYSTYSSMARWSKRFAHSLLRSS